MKELMELRQLAQQIDNQEAISLYNRVDKEIERLNKENKILRENAEHNDKVVDKVNWENKKLNNIIKHIENICESSISSVDKFLQDEKETKFENGRCTNRNGYQIERLKAYRTKSKEILGRIKELKGSDKE